MTVFGEYAAFYDCLYQDKNYEEECNFLEEIFNHYAHGSVVKILDLGCGTGGHSLVLKSRGYSVVGVDRSKEMLELARSKEGAEKVSFQHGDIRYLRLETTFDVVISMFAVMSYMVTNEDLIGAFQTVRRHLKPGGIFVFDSWFGPGVFHDPPTVRQKELINGEKRVIRTTSPGFDPIEQVVEVRFDVFEMLGDKKIEELTEHHLMRPLFVQEVKQFAGLSNMELLAVFPWMDINRKLTLDDWLAGFVLRAR
jgi:SAM-dependent methyltransferase